MRTHDEIVNRISELSNPGRRNADFFGFERNDLVKYLPFSFARPFLKDDVKESAWVQEALSDAQVLAEMYDYMPFAWDKANNCRGLSAVRSISHMKAWLWLLGEDALTDSMDELYNYYGKPCLRVICEWYGWNWRQWDNNRWGNSDNGPFHAAPSTTEPTP